jgi:hypothetical protein
LAPRESLHLGAKRWETLFKSCLNEAARAADATREALGAVVASQLG